MTSEAAPARDADVMLALAVADVLADLRRSVRGARQRANTEILSFAQNDGSKRSSFWRSQNLRIGGCRCSRLSKPYLPSTLSAMEKGGYTYLMASKGKRLYVGVTSRLMVRVRQHKERSDPHSFTARYNIDRLVYFEAFERIEEAIARESAIKNMHRIQKIQLIVALNPDWRDLSAEWGKLAKPFDESMLRPPSTF